MVSRALGQLQRTLLRSGAQKPVTNARQERLSSTGLTIKAKTSSGMRTKSIDASHLEGGGQVVRIAVTLSALTSTPIELHNIRGNRSGGGGLKGQHLTAIQWLAKACNAHVKGLELKSQLLTFQPGCGNTTKEEREALVQPVTLNCGTRALEMTVSLSTNGAATLVLQTLLPYLIFCPPQHPGCDRSKTPIVITVHGGTNVPLSPSIDYFLHILSPNLARLGIQPLELISLKRGYTTGARSGLGCVSVLIHPLPPGTKLPRLAIPPSLTQAEQPKPSLVRISIHILAPSASAISVLRATALSLVCKTFFPDLALPSTVGAAAPSQDGAKDGPPRVQIHTTSSADTSNKRFYLLLAATHVSGLVMGADWLYDGKGLRTVTLGRRNKGSGAERDLPKEVLESVANEMAERVVGELKVLIDEGRWMDRWMEDQIVVFRALAAGGREMRESERLTLDDAAGKGGADDEEGVGAERIGESGASLHTITARWVAHELLGVDFDQEGNCNGIGLEAV